MRQGQSVETVGPDAAGPNRIRTGPNAARPLRRCNCGSLTGDSGGPGRRARLMFFRPESAFEDDLRWQSV
jgi:hypothetical protein